MFGKYRTQPRPGLGLGGSLSRFGIPAAAASLPLRESTDLYPSWVARPDAPLHLGLGCSLHWGRARNIVAGFHRDRGGYELHVHDVAEDQAAEALVSGELDAAILAKGDVPVGLRAAPLWSERLIVAVPEGHRLAGANAVEPADLRQETILLAGAAKRNGLEHATRQTLAGAPASFHHEAVARDTLFDLVALGFGVTVAPGSTTGAFYPGVVFRPIANPQARIDYVLMWNPMNLGAALNAFVPYARNYSPCAGERA